MFSSMRENKRRNKQNNMIDKARGDERYRIQVFES